MDKDTLKRKLCSRKFWMAIAGLVSGLILAFGGEKATADTVCGCIMSVASVVAYTIGEGLADKGTDSQIYVTNNGNDALQIWDEETDEGIENGGE